MTPIAQPDPILIGIFLAVLSFLFGLLGKVLWDYHKSGRTEKGMYLTVSAFNEHRKECCAIELKKEFTACKQQSCTNQVKTEGRLDTIEDKLKDGHATFQALNDKMDEKFDAFAEKFDRMNQVLARIQAVLEFALDKKDRGE